jgi:hemolysin III
MNLQQYTPRQELANTLTHGIGIVLCIVAIPVLMAMAVKQDLSTRSMVGLSVYAVSLLLVYTTSTLYHAITSLRLKRIFKILDHICIYLLIGGSNTAFIPRFVDEKHATLVLATQWTLIAAGIVFKLYFTGKYKWLSTFFYIGLAGLPMCRQMQ